MNNTQHLTKNLLVTGKAGFIGSNFVHYWLEQYPEEAIVVLDALTYAGNRANLASVESNSNFKFVHGDILDTELVENLLSEEEIDTIVHFAAESHVDRSIHGPDAFLKTNIERTHGLLKAVKKIWLDGDVKSHRFHHVSTDEVYGALEPEAPAFTEKHQYLPSSPYSASKASSDHLVRAWRRTYGFPIVITNCSNNYGGYEFPEKLIPLVTLNALEGKPLPIYGKGNQIRDWLHVDDHARALRLVLAKGKTGETYNIGEHNEKTNLEVVKTICKLLDKLMPESSYIPHESLITYVADRPGHDLRYAIDADKIAAELGWTPEETFESGIEKNHRLVFGKFGMVYTRSRWQLSS